MLCTKFKLSNGREAILDFHLESRGNLSSYLNLEIKTLEYQASSQERRYYFCDAHMCCALYVETRVTLCLNNDVVIYFAEVVSATGR